MTALPHKKIVTALRGARLDLAVFATWRTPTPAWAPSGIVLEPTANSDSDPAGRCCTGPAWNAVVSRSGTVILTTAGPPHTRADGRGSYRVAAVHPGLRTVQWPPEQLDALTQVAVVLCRAQGWGPERISGPAAERLGLPLDALRERAKQLLDDREGHAPTPSREPYPGALWFRSYPLSPVVTATGRRLAEEGCADYPPGPQWAPADRHAYARWQRRQGLTGPAADGWPDPTTWDALNVPATIRTDVHP
ncbi:peptidoglycan-binding protein [Streptomyces syringium]|uniref:peptidoglycan-binding protein n=1 Tax=Streptomyces syringium TaxID=76729 RepID=UPI00345530E5